MRLLEALRIEAKVIASEIERSNLFSHMGDRGEFRERVIERFLRPFLPPCYGLAPGEVFSSDGQQSAQVDIVLYDAVFSTVLFRNGPRMLFPAESIYGSIEVKSHLSTDEMRTACDNVASVKRLQRLPTDTLDLLPHLYFRLGPGLMLAPGGTPRNPYTGIVFGYRGAAAETIMSTLSERARELGPERGALPDFVFVADPGYTIIRRKADGSPALPGNEFVRYECIQTGLDTLPLLFFSLNICLGEVRLRRPDLVALWDQVVTEAHAKAMANWADRHKNGEST